MKKKEPLFELIKSLTKNEKRFFKIHAARHVVNGENNYVKLFDLIDAQVKYDEEKLLKKTTNTKLAERLASEKHYLYNLILEFIDIYHNDSSVDRQIDKYINIAKILFDKQLYDQSKKIVDKAIKLASQYNRFDKIVVLALFLKDIEYERDTITEVKLEEYYSLVHKSITQLKVKLEYQKIRDNLVLQRRMMGVVKNTEELQYVKTIYKSEYFRDNSMSNSFDANVYYLLGKVEYYRMIRDYKMCGIYGRKLIAVFDSHSNRICDLVSLYLYALNSFIENRYNMGRRQEVQEVLEKVRKVPELIGKKNMTNVIEVKIFEIYYVGKTDFCLRYKEYEEGLADIKIIEEGLKEYNDKITPFLNLFILNNLAFLYFGYGDYKKALRWCNQILQNPPTAIREDVICNIKILNLLIHLELGNHLILPAIIKSTYRFLLKRKRVYKFETIFLKYIKRLYLTYSSKEQKKLLTDFREDIEPLLNDKFENAIFNEIDLIGWIDKRLNRPVR